MGSYYVYDVYHRVTNFTIINGRASHRRGYHIKLIAQKVTRSDFEKLVSKYGLNNLRIVKFKKINQL